MDFDNVMGTSRSLGARAGASPAPTLYDPCRSLRSMVGAGLALHSSVFWKGPSESEVGGVILSAAKDLSSGRAQILRCAQDDSLWPPARFKKTDE
jgi:hypothetical protein